MKIKFEGNLTLEQFGKLVADVVKDFLDKAEVEEGTVTLDNPIVQTAFKIEGQEEAVFMTTEHNEMLQVTAEVKDGKIVSDSDNQEEPTEDKRLWSYEKLAGVEPTEAPTEQIKSNFRPKELEYVKEFHVTDSIVQEVHNIIGTNEQLIRYININLEGDGIVAEEVVAPKEDESI
jgi:hypothetical protein